MKLEEQVKFMESGGPGSGRHAGGAASAHQELEKAGFKKSGSAKWPKGQLAGGPPTHMHPEGHAARVSSNGGWNIMHKEGRLRMGNGGDNTGLIGGHMRDLGIK